MILLGLSIYSLETYFYNVELNEIVTDKDKILGDLLLNDSIHNLSEKKYSENILKYVKECSFIVNGKTISSQELVNIVQKLYNERDNLNYEKAIKSDSLKHYIHRQKFDEELKDDCLKIVRRRTDSLQLYMGMLEVIEKKYKIGVRARIEGSNMVFSTPINKIDSALAVYKYYKHKLKVDKNVFTVEIDSDYPYSEKTKKKSEKPE